MPKNKLISDYIRRFGISFDKVDHNYEEGEQKIEGKYCLSIWCNDMYGWALSYAMSFIPKDNQSLKEVYKKFVEWCGKEGNVLFEKFKSVEYPDREKGTYTAEFIQEYFDKNWIIGKEIMESIDEFCGQNVNEF